jgi:hypothetical protein
VMYKKPCSQLMIFISFSIEKIIIPCPYCASFVPPNLLHTHYLVNSLAAAISEPALYRLLTFRVPNLMSLFRCLGRIEVSVQVRGFVCEHFVTKIRFHGKLLAPRPTPKLEDHLLSAVRDCLFNIFAATLPLNIFRWNIPSSKDPQSKRPCYADVTTLGTARPRTGCKEVSGGCCYSTGTVSAVTLYTAYRQCWQQSRDSRAITAT